MPKVVLKRRTRKKVTQQLLKTFLGVTALCPSKEGFLVNVCGKEDEDEMTAYKFLAQQCESKQD